jgi:hypothetical protein
MRKASTAREMPSITLRLKRVNLTAGPGRLDVQAVAAQEIETRIGSVP